MTFGHILTISYRHEGPSGARLTNARNAGTLPPPRRGRGPVAEGPSRGPKFFGRGPRKGRTCSAPWGPESEADKRTEGRPDSGGPARWGLFVGGPQLRPRGARGPPLSGPRKNKGGGRRHYPCFFRGPKCVGKGPEHLIGWEPGQGPKRKKGKGQRYGNNFFLRDTATRGPTKRKCCALHPFPFSVPAGAVMRSTKSWPHCSYKKQRGQGKAQRRISKYLTHHHYHTGPTEVATSSGACPARGRRSLPQRHKKRGYTTPDP